MKKSSNIVVKRGLIISLMVCLVLLQISSFAQSALKVEKVSITVKKLEVSVPFYQEVLNFKKIKEYTLEGTDLQRLLGISNENLSAKIVELQLGDETIALQEFVNETSERNIPIDSRSNDLWFQHIAIVVSDMDKAYKKLWNAGVVHVSTSPQTLPEYIPAAAGIKAFYFRDPDGHNLELIYFPKGKGDHKWQGNSDNLFLGIDHTAIGIALTKLSTPFYEDLVGLKIKGHSENFGSEQEHLNQVFGARLWISGLKAKDGIGVEFLDYIAPPGGREYPKDSQTTDLWHWHTTVQVENVDELYKKMQLSNVAFISNGIVHFNGKSQYMVRDPDGHAILLTE